MRPYSLPLAWLSRRASSPVVLLRRYGECMLGDLIAEMQPGDELRKFDSPRENWRRKAGRFGYALVREGKPIGMVVLRMN